MRIHLNDFCKSAIIVDPAGKHISLDLHTFICLFARLLFVCLFICFLASLLSCCLSVLGKVAKTPGTETFRWGVASSFISSFACLSFLFFGSFRL